jgi:hypothetical protein
MEVGKNPKAREIPGKSSYSSRVPLVTAPKPQQAGEDNVVNGGLKKSLTQNFSKTREIPGLYTSRRLRKIPQTPASWGVVNEGRKAYEAFLNPGRPGKN